MVLSAGLTTILGLSLAGDLYGTYQEGKAAKNLEDYYRDLGQDRRRSEGGLLIQDILGDIQGQRDALPRLQERILGRASGQRETQLSDLEERISRGGVEGASELGTRGRRRTLDDIEKRELQGLLGFEDLQSRVNTQGIQTAGAGLNFLYPSPNATTAGAAPTSFSDYSGVFNNALLFSMLGSDDGGGGSGNFTNQPFSPTSGPGTPFFNNPF